MKKLKIALLTTLTALFFNLSFAQEVAQNDDSKLIIKVNEGKADKSVEVRLANLCLETTKVKVKSMTGRTYYRETVKNKTGYSKSLKLEDFNPGHYHLIIERPASASITEFMLTNNELVIGETSTFLTTEEVVAANTDNE